MDILKFCSEKLFLLNRYLIFCTFIYMKPIVEFILGHFNILGSVKDTGCVPGC